MNKMRTIFNILVLLMISTTSFANVSLPKIFSDNMVLQRNAEVKIWGWAKPGEEVSIRTTWSEEVYKTKPNNMAYWEVILSTPDVRGSQQVTVQGYNQIVLKNVLLGEVWLVSGQSNMEWSADAGITNAEEAIAGAENPKMRFFSLVHRTAEDPQQDLEGSWVESTPQSMRYFSAVAYFFGKKLQEELDVPVGLINSSWGGTPAEVWIPSEKINENERLSEAAALLPDVEYGPNAPGSIYNAMIAPLIPFKIAGILWYQGESNTGNAEYYEEMFSSLIQSWRTKWEEELPFYYAQIAPYDYGDNFAGVKVRDAQRRVLALPKTGMIMTSDIGNVKDIHPRNKLDVGLRFAKLALSEIYNKETGDAYAPLFDHAEADGSIVKVHFLNADGLYFDKNDVASQFEVAGENGNFHRADVKIENSKVLLSSPEVKNPEYVRFSWGNMSTSNLFNAAGLPASSFTEEVK